MKDVYWSAFGACRKVIGAVLMLCVVFLFMAVTETSAGRKSQVKTTHFLFSVITGLEFSPDGRVLYFNYFSKHPGSEIIGRYNIETDKLDFLVPPCGYHWTGISISPDGKKLLTRQRHIKTAHKILRESKGGKADTIVEYDLTTGKTKQIGEVFTIIDPPRYVGPHGIAFFSYTHPFKKPRRSPLSTLRILKPPYRPSSISKSTQIHGFISPSPIEYVGNGQVTFLAVATKENKLYDYVRKHARGYYSLNFNVFKVDLISNRVKVTLANELLDAVYKHHARHHPKPKKKSKLSNELDRITRFIPINREQYCFVFKDPSPSPVPGGESIYCYSLKKKSISMSLGIHKVISQGVTLKFDINKKLFLIAHVSRGYPRSFPESMVWRFIVEDRHPNRRKVINLTSRTIQSARKLIAKRRCLKN